jgi:cysteine desulfurase
MNGDTIYLDHAATTPVDRRVFEAMAPYLGERFGNPSSIYQLGQESHAAVDRARGSIARVLGCDPAEIVFTSGATESDNLALSGVAWRQKLANPMGPPPHIVTTQVEHHAVLHTADWLRRVGFAVTLVPCDRVGIVAVEGVLAALRPETCLVSVMYANNEVGAVQPVAEIGAALRERGITFHVDATQAAGLRPLKVGDLNADLLSLSAHKFYGPKGVGLLFVRRQTPIAFQQHGGGQEGGRRGGTENVAGIVGMAVALELAEESRPAYREHCKALRDRLLDGITERIPDVAVNGPEADDRRLENNVNLAIRGVQGETVLLSLDMQGVAASAGSACTTGNSEPSHVLLAMGLGEERARSSLRFTVGRSNTADEIDEAVDILEETVERVRALSGLVR